MYGYIFIHLLIQPYRRVQLDACIHTEYIYMYMYTHVCMCMYL